jgi:PAS domain S-box-containing protein
MLRRRATHLAGAQVPPLAAERYLLDALPCATLLLDDGGDVRHANPVALRLLEELDLAVFAAPTAPSPYRIVLPGQDGERHFDVSVVPLVVDELPHRLVSIDDVTELARAEARLAHLEAFAAASGDALFSQDAEGLLVTWSANAERVFGVPAADVLGRPVQSLFPEHFQADMKVVLDAVAEGERVEQVEAEVQRRGGMLVPIALSMSPVLDRDGDVVGAVAVAQDLTEKLLTQAALAEVEARLREGEALAHVGRWVWDVGTGAVQWSAELHRIHDVDPLDFAGDIDAFLACVHGEDRDGVRTAMEAAVAEGRQLEVEYRTARADGAVHWVYATAEPMLGSAEVVVGLRGIGQDLTDRRSAPDER